MRIYPINYTYNSYKMQTFKGTKDEIVSEGLKEFVSDVMPLYKVGRTLYKIGDGDTKGAVKQAVGAVDNIVLQPVKQSVAVAVAAKGAAIGSVICPGVGTAIGATIGYLGTLLGWGKARNCIVDSVMED